MPIQFNSAGANSFTPLIPVDGGLGGWLSAQGNVVSDRVEFAQLKGYSASGPGTSYAFRQVTGRVPRVVDWLWRCNTPTAVDMNRVENLLQSYASDGRPYLLEDADGRLGNAVLSRIQVIQHRRTSFPSAVTALLLLRFQCTQSTLQVGTL